MKNKQTIILFSVAICICLLVFGWVGFAQAANCGPGTGKETCECGDTVTSAYTLNSDLNCTTSFALTVQANLTLNANITTTGHGLVVGANGITIDGGNHTITGDTDPASDYGINNTGGYDNITIKNFAHITNFEKGIYLSNTCGGSSAPSSQSQTPTEPSPPTSIPEQPTAPTQPKPIQEMTLPELQTIITQVQEQLLNLPTQLIQLLQEQILQLQKQAF